MRQSLEESVVFVEKKGVPLALHPPHWQEERSGNQFHTLKDEYGF